MPRGPAATDPLKLWIMTAVVEGRRAFLDLRPPEADHHMNMSFPDMPVSDLVEACLELLEEGLIFANARGRRVRPDRSRLNRWFAAKRRLISPPYYGLTPAGGLLWEFACRAVWRDYVTNSMTSFECDKDGDIARCTVVYDGASEERVWLYSLAYPGGNHHLRSFRWSNLNPWKVTYWKKLPKGVRLTCSYEKRNYDSTRAKIGRQMWSLGRWFVDPPRAYEFVRRHPVHPCQERSIM